jgi:hypothetical protein
VNGGRSHLNFTQWDRPQRHAKDVSAQVKQGDMPPRFYLPMHPEARLTEAEKQDRTVSDIPDLNLGNRTILRRAA